MSRGFSLPGILGGCLLLFVLFISFQRTADHQRRALSQAKYREAARWMAISGADLAEARYQKGTLKLGETLLSPSRQHGYFSARVQKRGGQLMIVSSGQSGSQEYSVKRTLP